MSEIIRKPSKYLLLAQVIVISFLATGINGMYKTWTKPVPLNERENAYVANSELLSHFERKGYLNGFTFVADDQMVSWSDMLFLKTEREQILESCPISLEKVLFKTFSNENEINTEFINNNKISGFLSCVDQKIDTTELSRVTLQAIVSNKTYKKFNFTPTVKTLVDQAKQDGKITLKEYLEFRAVIYNLSRDQNANIEQELLSRL